jgi:hypothetical protein
MEWPPRDPREDAHADPDDHALALPASPWTFGTGSYNPALRPSSSGARRRHAAVPPYHPDFDAGDDGRPYFDSSSDDDGPSRAAVRVRQGSEGPEVRPLGRDELVRRYVDENAREPGRYRRYVPDEASASEDEEEHVPLALLHPYAPA